MSQNNTSREYRRRLLLLREYQTEKDVLALKKPKEPEEEYDDDVDDGDEDVEWAGDGGKAGKKADDGSDAGDGDGDGDGDGGGDDDGTASLPSVPTSQLGGEEEAAVEMEEEEEEVEAAPPPPPIPPFFELLTHAGMSLFLRSEMHRWSKGIRCSLHTLSRGGWSMIVRASHDGDRPLLQCVLYKLRQPLPQLPEALQAKSAPADSILQVAAVSTATMTTAPESAPTASSKRVSGAAVADAGAVVARRDVAMRAINASSARRSATALRTARSSARSSASSTPLSSRSSSSTDSIPPLTLARAVADLPAPQPALTSFWLYSRLVVNHHTDDGDTALQWAVKEDHIHISKALLGVPGLHANCTDSTDTPALIVAVRLGLLEQVKALLRCPHIDPDAAATDRVSGLMTAVHNRNYPLISAFMDVTRCNVNQRDPADMTPLTIALHSQDALLFECIAACPRTDWDCPDAEGRMPLMIACATNQVSVVERLVAMTKRVNINLQDRDGFTALMHAVVKGFPECARVLMAQPHLQWMTTTKASLSVVDLAKRRVFAEGGHRARHLVLARERLLQCVRAWMKRIREAWDAEVSDESAVDYSDF